MKESTPAAPVRAILLTATLLWGLNMPIVKWLTGQFDPVLLSGMRMFAAAVAVVVLLRRGRAWPRLQPAQWRKMLVCGALMVYLNQLLLTYGLARTSAANGALITALNPLVAALLALWLLRERLSVRRLLGVLLGLSGVALVVLQRPKAELAHGGVGDLLVLLAVIAFTCGAVLLQRLSVQLDALVIAVGINVAGTAFLALHGAAQALWTGALPRASGSVAVWIVLLLSGAVSMGIGNLLWNRGVAAIGMARAAVWLYWVPIFGITAAVVFLGEPLTVWHPIGLALVLGGTRLGAPRKT